MPRDIDSDDRTPSASSIESSSYASSQLRTEDETTSNLSDSEFLSANQELNSPHNLSESNGIEGVERNSYNEQAFEYTNEPEALNPLDNNHNSMLEVQIDRGDHDEFMEDSVHSYRLIERIPLLMSHESDVRDTETTATQEEHQINRFW